VIALLFVSSLGYWQQCRKLLAAELEHPDADLAVQLLIWQFNC
jgi:hypothetical protein